jgi:hypothetical protein
LIDSFNCFEPNGLKKIVNFKSLVATGSGWHTLGLAISVTEESSPFQGITWLSLREMDGGNGH